MAARCVSDHSAHACGDDASRLPVHYILGNEHAFYLLVRLYRIRTQMSVTQLRTRRSANRSRPVDAEVVSGVPVAAVKPPLRSPL